jgi:hypothetical protein
MKRNEIVKSLIKEGFSEKTLVNFSDKQLMTLASRLLGEADVMISKKDPLVNQKIDDAKKQNKSIETYEEDMKEELKGGQKKLDKNHNGKIDSQDFKILKGQKKKDSNKKDEKENIKEWVSTVTKKNFHSFTSKNEIMEMIQFKLKEEVGANVKKGHNGIPEFMTYDAISDTDTISAEPITKPAPTKDPKVNPTKPRTPYSPKPGEKSKPKAMGENSNKKS